MQLNLVAFYNIIHHTYIISQFEKLKLRFMSKPKDFTFDELTSLLKALGFSLSNNQIA